MGRSSRNGNPRTPNSGWKGWEKKRCVSCRKRAKDIIEGTPLCRIHSPARDGYKKIIEDREKAMRKERKK